MHFRTVVSALVVTMLLTAGAVLAKRPSASSATPVPSVAPSSQPTSEPASTAIPRLEAKLKANPNDSESMAELAGYYLDTGRPDFALPLTHRLIALGAKATQVYYIDGVANEQLGHLQEATASLEHASTLDPTNAPVLFTLTDLYLRANRPQDAERVAKRATTFNATDKRTFLNYGVVLMQERKFDAARAQFEQAAKLDPKDPGPVVLEARSYEGQNARDLALQTFDRALTIDPKSFDALLGKAHFQASQHDVKGAVATFEAALSAARNDEERVAILDQEADLYLGAKMLGDAEIVLKRSIAGYPAVHGAHLAYGDFYASQHKFPAALAQWKLALGPGNDSRAALFRLGEYYEQSDQPGKAVEMYQRAVVLNGNDPQALAQLGQAYGLNRQFDKAHDAYRHSFALVRTPQALAGIAASDYQLKKYQEGAAAFDALGDGASDFLKSNPQLYYVMGKLYTGNNEKTKARLAYKRFLSFVKPGTPVQSEVKKLIATLDSTSSSASKPTGKPKS